MLSAYLAEVTDQHGLVLAAAAQRHPPHAARPIGADRQGPPQYSHPAPGIPAVQARLGEVARVVATAADLLGGDTPRAIVWFRHQPLAGFDGRTAEELVAAGHTDAVLAHLEMLRDGGYA